MTFASAGASPAAQGVDRHAPDGGRVRPAARPPPHAASSTRARAASTLTASSSFLLPAAPASRPTRRRDAARGGRRARARGGRRATRSAPTWRRSPWGSAAPRRRSAAVVLVRDSSHFGAASYYAELAAARGMIGLSLGDSDPGMAPVGTLGPLLGTNPFAFAAPAPAGVVAPDAGHRHERGRAGQGDPAPACRPADPGGLGHRSRRAPTTDPTAALRTPFSPSPVTRASASASCSTFCAVPAGRSGQPPHRGGADADDPGHRPFPVAVDVAAFYPEGTGRVGTARGRGPRPRLVRPVRGASGSRGARGAGTVERADGIPLDAEVTRLLRQLGDDYGVPFIA